MLVSLVAQSAYSKIFQRPPISYSHIANYFNYCINDNEKNGKAIS
jgi:hypothetical protein